MTELERLQAHLGEDRGETVFERACIIWADRVPWDRALTLAEAQKPPPAGERLPAQPEHIACCLEIGGQGFEP